MVIAINQKNCKVYYQNSTEKAIQKSKVWPTTRIRIETVFDEFISKLDDIYLKLKTQQKDLDSNIYCKIKYINFDERYLIGDIHIKQSE